MLVQQLPPVQLKVSCRALCLLYQCADPIGFSNLPSEGLVPRLDERQVWVVNARSDLLRDMGSISILRGCLDKHSTDFDLLLVDEAYFLFDETHLPLPIR